MLKIQKQKVIFFEKKITDFFHKAGREHLPWRKPRKASPRGSGKITAYEVWVSEVMLQQTQVVRVIGYYKRFLKRFPTVRKLAKATWAEFLPYYDGLGYYSRGRNMLKAAHMVMKEYAGKFPREKKLLEELPGIGPYTAAAIMSFAYGDNHLAWDTNLKRVIGRFFFGTKNFTFVIPAYEPESRSRVPPKAGMQSGMTLKKLEKQFTLPAKTLNAALMDFGSALCVARPKCAACMLRERCAYYREKGRREGKDKRCPPTGEAGMIRDKKKKKIDWGGAKVILFLHENHKKYYSTDRKEFRPFFLPPAYNTRAGIKQYFRDKYSLTLSVRPPHEKAIVGNEPVLFVNAQVLLGEPSFPVFSKKDKGMYDKSPGKKVQA